MKNQINIMKMDNIPTIPEIDITPLFSSMGLSKEHFNKPTMDGFKKGDELKIKDSCKEELTTSFELTGGMSGVSSTDINKTYLYLGNEGSNIRASIKGDEARIFSLNHSRFEKQN